MGFRRNRHRAYDLSTSAGQTPFRRWGHFWSADKPDGTARPRTEQEGQLESQDRLYYRNYDEYPDHGRDHNWNYNQVFEIVMGKMSLCFCVMSVAISVVGIWIPLAAELGHM